MDRAQIILENPKSIQASDLGWIKEKMKQYPYVATYHIWYLRALQLTDYTEYKKELPHHSQYFNQPEYAAKLLLYPIEKSGQADKNSLAEKNLSINETNSVVKTPIEKKSESLSEEFIQKETAEEKDSHISIVENHPTATTIDADTNSPNEKNSTDKTKSETIEQNVTSEEEALAANLRKLGLEHLIPKMQSSTSTPKAQDSIVEIEKIDDSTESVESHNTTSLKEHDNTEVETEELVDQEAQSIKKQETTESHEINPELENKEHSIQEGEDIKEEIPTTVTEDMGFTNEEKSVIENETSEVENSKLETEQKNNLETNTIERADDSEKYKTITDSVLFENKKTFSDWLGLYQKQTTIEPQSVDKQEEAIDNFIENNPKIKIEKDENNSLVDINSIVENDQTISHLMTETLAQLYVEQKKYNKAIEAYEILILKNPEKSSIFADQIQKLKNLK